MIRRTTMVRGAALGLLLLALAAAPGAAQPWNQAYGNGNNTSFRTVQSAMSLAPAWRFPLAGLASWAGPAVAADGTVWVGTTNGVLHAVNPNGTQRCSLSFGAASITSTPAVLPNGQVGILFHRPDVADPTKNQTSLALVSPGCSILWSQPLPRLDRKYPSTATGSVKLWTSDRMSGSFLFVHGHETNERFFLDDPDRNQTSEILVYAEDGTLFARHPLSRDCFRVSGGGGFDSWSDFFDWATSWWPEAGTVDPLYTIFGWPDSTPAVVSTKLTGLADPTEPMIAVTDHFCEPRLETYQLHPSVTNFDLRLTQTWSKKIVGEGTLLSSPAVTETGIVYVGSSDNRLRAFDLLGNGLLWEKDTKQPVMHPPAVTPAVLYAQTDTLLWSFQPDGSLFPTGSFTQPWSGGSKVGAGAANQIETVFGHYKEWTSLTPDMHNQGHALTHDHFQSTNPAITASGRVYVITQTDPKRAELVALGANP